MTQIIPYDDAVARLKQELGARKNKIAQLLPPDFMDPARYLQLAQTMCEKTPALMECTPLSLCGGIIESAQLGLPLDNALGYAYLVPFFDRKSNERRAVFIPGYKGLMELARRSSHVAHIWADVVRKGDTITEERGDQPRLIHIPLELEERTAEYLDDKNITGAYACAKLTNGTICHVLMSRVEINSIRERSRAKNAGPWVTDFPAMAKKTPIRQLCKFLPLSPEDMRQVGRDELIDAGIDPPRTQEEEAPEVRILSKEEAEPSGDAFKGAEEKWKPVDVTAETPEEWAKRVHRGEDYKPVGDLAREEAAEAFQGAVQAHLEDDVLQGGPGPDEPGGGPVDPVTLEFIVEAAKARGWDDAQLSEHLDKIYGVTEPWGLEQDDAVACLRELKKG